MSLLPGFSHLARRLPVNADGALLVESTNDRLWNIYTNYGIDSQAVVQDQTTRLYALRCYNKASALRFLQIFNRANSPETGDEPLLTFPIAAGGYLVLGSNETGSRGIPLSAGLAFGFSTTELTYTGAPASEHSTVIFYTDDTVTVNNANFLL